MYWTVWAATITLDMSPHLRGQHSWPEVTSWTHGKPFLKRWLTSDWLPEYKMSSTPALSCYLMPRCCVVNLCRETWALPVNISRRHYLLEMYHMILTRHPVGGDSGPDRPRQDTALESPRRSDCHTTRDKKHLITAANPCMESSISVVRGGVLLDLGEVLHAHYRFGQAHRSFTSNPVLGNTRRHTRA